MFSMDNPKFSFRFVSLNETSDGVNKLIPEKASQTTDMPVKIIKENKDPLPFYIFIISTTHYQVALLQLQ